MKLQFNTDNKTISIEGLVNLKEFIKTVKALLPNEWEKYSIESVTYINNWTNPVIIREITGYPLHPPTYPWQQPITYMTGESTQSTYNVEISNTGC